jgi:hypothetical protein
MAVNVGGHGYDLVRSSDPAAQSQVRRNPIRSRPEIAREKKRVENFFDFSSPNQSFASLRELTTWDK